MRINVSLDTQAVITQPSPARAKAGSFVPVEIAFTRGSQSVMLPPNATIELALKPKNTWTGGILVYHADFAAGAGNLYIGSVNFASEPLLAALGLTDNAPANDIGQIETAAEISWTIGSQRFRSATFALTVEAPLTEAIIIPPTDPTLYPAPEEIEIVARKGQPDGYAGLDDSGKVPSAHLPRAGASLHETPNRFTADHSGWLVGDIIRQLGDSSAASLSIEVTSPVPGGTQGVVEIAAAAVPEGESSGFQLSSNFGSSDQLPVPGPLSASEHATQIHALLDASGLGTSVASGDTLTFTFNSQGSAGSSISGAFATLDVIEEGTDQVPFAFSGDFFDQSGNYYSPYAEVYGPMTAAGFAQEIANALISAVPFLDVSRDDTVVTANFNFLGFSPDEPYLYDPYGSGPLWQATFTNGIDGVPSGTFVVTDLSHLGSAYGYEGIGVTVDFLSGYGAPTSTMGSVGNGYVDLNNGDFYHRSESGWTFVLNIKGPPGPQGIQGPAGPQGPYGVSGLFKACTSSDFVVDSTGYDKIWPIKCNGDSAGAYSFTGTLRVHQATIASGRSIRIKSLSNNSAAPGATGFITSVKYTDAAGLNTPGAVVTSPLVHSGGGDWDIGPNISMDGAYGLVVQWAFVCKFNTSPMLAMEIYGGSLANPVIVKAGSGCVLTKLG